MDKMDSYNDETDKIKRDLEQRILEWEIENEELRSKPLYVTKGQVEMADSQTWESLKYLEQSSKQIKEETLEWFKSFVGSCSDEMLSLQMATKMELERFNKTANKAHMGMGLSLRGEF